MIEVLASMARSAVKVNIFLSIKKKLRGVAEYQKEFEGKIFARELQAIREKGLFLH